MKNKFNELSEEIFAKLRLYEEFLRENAVKSKIVLMEKPDSPEFFNKQVLEASLYLPFIHSGDTVIDIGSGAGFPGVPLAIMKQDVHFILTDRKRRYFEFLKHTKETLGLNNVSVVLSEAEKLRKALKERDADVICARAVSRIKNILLWAEPVLKDNGLVVLGKGRHIEKEISDASEMPYSLVKTIETNFGHIVVYKKATRE